MAERDNVRVWDGAKRGHYEVWYLTLNHRPSRTGYWIRYTLESPLDGVGEPYAQLWFARFDKNDPGRTFAINHKLPIASMTADADPFAVAIGDARLTDSSADGALTGDGHTVRWQLSWSPAHQTHRQLPDVMYRRGGLGDTTVLSPNLDVLISGVIEVDGEQFEICDEPGGQTHLWGRKHAHSWAWGHCNAFEGAPGSALETLTVRLKKGGRVLPPLTVLCLYHQGDVYRFNQYRNVLFTGGDYQVGRYRFRARGMRIRLEGEYSCRPEDMVLTEYHDPDGEPSYCANTEVADLRLTLYEREGPMGLAGRWRERARLLAPGTGHFEVASRQPDPAVSTHHVPV